MIIVNWHNWGAENTSKEDPSLKTVIGFHFACDYGFTISLSLPEQTLVQNRSNMTSAIGTAKHGMEMEMKRDGGFLSNATSRKKANDVFKLEGSDRGEDLSSEFGGRQGANGLDAREGAAKMFLRRKIAAHIKTKSEREREVVQRGMLSKIGEPMSSDFVQINNNLSLQISRHTSRHSRYADDSSTDSDNDSVDSFCGDDELTNTEEVDGKHNSLCLS